MTEEEIAEKKAQDEALELLAKKKRSAIEAKHKAHLEYRKQFLVREITTETKEDLGGRPSGGSSTGIGLTIIWQSGERGKNTDANPNAKQIANGAAVDDVIEICRNRLAYLDSKLPSEENKVALASLNEALNALVARKADRQERGVDGLDKA